MDGRTALVLGASGGVGGAVARKLAAEGWRVRAMLRDPRKAAGFEAVAGDAMVACDVARAAAGASLIVHAVNPPGYHDWAGQVLPMLDNTIAAARGARILLPGTVYNFGPDALDCPGEDAAQNPVTRKGRIRAEMEARLHRAAACGRARVLIVRAGDFFGPQAGKPGVGHQWAYLPDVAETMVRLAGLPGLGAHAVFHMAGHWDPDGMAMARAIQAALGAPPVKLRRMPWWAMRLASPVVPLFRELLEMRYLWQRPVRMGNARLVAALGAEPHTPLDAAVRETLRDMGCLSGI